MKLLFAGTVIDDTIPGYSGILFNCTRNQRCERAFFVPVANWSDLMFYVDLPGKPTTIETAIVSLCGTVEEGSAVFDKYVVGKKPNGSWYGVFGSIIQTLPEGGEFNCFILRMTFTVGTTQYVYYTEQMCFPICETLTKLQGCYPNEPFGTSAIDCNGIYYGFPENDNFLGTYNYRYFHWAFVRMGSITETKDKLSFTIFNSRRAYKNIFSREWTFEFELVPTFFKNILLGIFNRGNIRIENSEWLLASDQEITIIDNDCKLWKCDIVLTEECRQYFDCGQSDCKLPQDCCDPVVVSATVEELVCCDPEVISATKEAETFYVIDSDGTRLKSDAPDNDLVIWFPTG